MQLGLVWTDRTMKFTKYHQDTHIPEWEKAYIDYSGLKVQLSFIRTNTLRTFGNEDARSVPNDEEKYDSSRDPYVKQGNIMSAPRSGTNDQFELPSFGLALASPPSNSFTQQMRPHSLGSRRSPSVSTLSKDQRPLTSSFRAMLSDLPASHAKFFDILDAELDRIETFYVEREEEMQERAKVLRKQLAELVKHRRLFYKENAARSKAQSWAKRARSTVLSLMTRWIPSRNTRTQRANQARGNGLSGSELGRGTRGPGHKGLGDDHYVSWSECRMKGAEQYFGNVFSSEAADGFTKSPPERPNAPKNPSSVVTRRPLQSHEYGYAKKMLREAVVEHYRGLEALANYRTLNLVGFRKALKKYEKITKIPVLDAYMKEKVETTTFASSTLLSAMLKETEHIFAVRFERGNRRKAINHLRVRPTPKARHVSAFRSGLWLGLAVFATAGGCYLSFRKQTRDAIPSWSILLFIYSILFLPILLALLIGTNIFVWMRYRINYAFIFKLNSRSRLDYREYFELPSFLFFTLACAFWFSLAGVGSPTLWPLIWLVLTLLMMFNPISSVMWGQTRWWIIKKIAKLGASGLSTVEFMDLWLGDQACSLTYSFANLYFVGCFYSRAVVDHSSTQSVDGPAPPSSPFYGIMSSAYDPQVQQAWATCGVSQNWGLYYLLAVLPFLARFLQSLRRYWDSRLPTQLINAGKYGVGIIESFFYFYWRHQMSPRTGQYYALFCLAATLNSLYGCAWDILADWSMCKLYSKYPLLRPQLVYKSHVSLYYIAMLTNLCIRFIWLIYIFFDKGNIEMYAFIAAMLEMLRRVLWNFYRVENKHLSNMETYRVTRELPLPYDLDMQSEEERAAQLRMRKRIMRLS